MSPNRPMPIMLRLARRPMAAVLLGVFLLQATGCTVVRRDATLMDVMRTRQPIVGVTATTGQPIPFDGPGWISGDTVYGPVKTQPGLEQADTAYMIPFAMVDSVWVRRTGVPTGLLVGVGLVSAAILLLATIQLGEAGIPIR